MIKTIVLAVASTLVLGACSTTPAWKTAKAAAPLTMPAGIDTPGTSNELVVPKAAGAGDAKGVLRSTRPPATNQGIVLAEDADAGWKHVGAVLKESGVGKIVASDAHAHSYNLVLSAADVNPGHRSWRERLFHRTPDIEGSHLASVSVVDDGKGRSNVLIDGDDLAVQKLAKVLHASSTTVATVKADEGDSVPDASTKKHDHDSLH